MLVSDFIRILDLAVGPAILVSGIGLLLLSLTNRFARIIDRARILIVPTTAADGIRSERVSAQLRILARRARALRTAITLAVVSLLFTVLLVMGLFAASAYRIESQPAGIALASCFTASMVALVAALVFFLYELNLSLRALWLELGTDYRDRRRFGSPPL